MAGEYDPALDPYSAGGGTSFPAQVGTSIGGGMFDPTSTSMRMLENFPSATSVMGWNTLRGSSTLMHGGFMDTAGKGFVNHVKVSNGWKPVGAVQPYRHTGFWNGAFRNQADPRAFFRMHSSSVFSNETGRGATYSPFNFLANTGNWAINKTLKTDTKATSGIAARIKNSSLMTPEVKAAMEAGETPRMLESGMFARTVAFGRQARLDVESAKGAKVLGSSMDVINKLDPGVRTAWRAEAGLRPTTGRELAEFTMLSAKSPVGQYVGGYMSKMAGGLTEGSKAATVASRLGRQPFLAGAARAERTLAPLIEGGVLKVGEKAGLKTVAAAAGKGLMGKAAAAAGVNAIPVVGQVASAVMTAMLVHDIAKMGIAAMEGGVDTAKDAFRSFQGSINKPVMGMGFKDNSVAQTSRQRGVMAISNSRLNARSVLGAEGSAMHARFG